MKTRGAKRVGGEKEKLKVVGKGNRRGPNPSKRRKG